MSTEADRSVILGVSCDLHDSAAALVVDGTVVAAAAEERFTRRKHDGSMPENAIAWCLEFADIGPGELGRVAFHDKPLTTYERILVTHARVGPGGFDNLAAAIASWSRSKLWRAPRIERVLARLGHPAPRISYAEHHQSHAAAAFHPSPFERAAILTFDGVGEWATSSIGHGVGPAIEITHELRFPDSVGLLYSTLTAHCGFAVNDGEYKLMGLAPYGTPRFADRIRSELVEICPDGSIRLDQRFFGFQAGRRMGSRHLDALLEGPPRDRASAVGQREADIAASTQVVIEDVVLAMARHAHDLTGESAACLAGGVALNCVANSRILRDGPFDDLWIQPASGDDGSAVGAALWAHHQLDGAPRSPLDGDAMSGCLLGPAFGQAEIVEWLNSAGIDFDVLADDTVFERTAAELAAGHLVGWFRGRMEFGPRALGNRSILADPRDPAVVQRINLAVKRREGFRPFAPAVLQERAGEWFELDRALPYMLVTVPVRESKRSVPADTDPDAGFAERLGRARSEIAACTHVDHSARVQTVDAGRHPDFHRLIAAFDALTGCPVVLNTSFNGNDEPIVRSPAEALRRFVDSDLDVLVLENCFIDRAMVAALVPR